MALLLLGMLTCATALAAERPWQKSSEFSEAWFTADIGSDIRIHVNAPLDATGKPMLGTRVIVFALPNGNTLEQTLGCQSRDGLDWHYNIQHIAAQTRLLRTLFPNEQIVLLCAEAKGLSWPAWRASHSDANSTIARLLTDWRDEFGTPQANVMLTGHSGGGSFTWGVIEGSQQLPDFVDRIAFLDSNYSFDDKLHGDKLRDWLTSDARHQLIVIAYDDREITLNGKKVVGASGGTFRATERMREALAPRFPLSESRQPPFDVSTGLDGRIRCLVHPNPDNKILHTVLVGEMNGLVAAATLGTAQQQGWGNFGGRRAYEKFIQQEPTPSGKAHQ